MENQGNLGICWAFSTLESVESGLMKRSLAPAGLDLSETHLSYSAYHGTTKDPEDPTAGETFIASENRWTRLGGNKFYATATLARGYGVAYEKDFPLSLTYQADASDTLDSKTSILDSVITDDLKKSSVSRLKNAYWLLDINAAKTAEDRVKRVNAVKSFIYRYGAVETGLRVNGYNAPYDAETNSFYTAPDMETTPNHSVALVGWDDEKVTKAPEPGAFLVQNSWGENGGEKGLFWLSYQDCSMKSPAFYEMKDEPVGQVKDVILHQYDGTGYNSVIRPAAPRDDLRISGANVFQAKEAQYLTSVSFYAGASALPYSISIYRNVSGAPDTGFLAATVSGRNNYAGYYTVDLEKPVPIAPGEKFAVQLTFDNKNGYVPHEKGKTTMRQYTADYGQSYLYDGKAWVDLMDLRDNSGEAYGCNLCIKATGERTTDPITLNPEAPTVKAGLSGDNTLKITVENADVGIDGYSYVVGTTADFLTTRKFTAKKANTLDLAASFSHLAKGTYYAAVRCYREGSDGTILYSPWSQVTTVKVEINAPAAPKISSAKASGNRVTVAVKAASVGEGTLVFALGNTPDFISQGKYVKSMRVTGARKATFDYVPKGTYYAAVRAFNLVNGKKIYSSWTKVLQVQVTGTTPETPVLTSVTPGAGTLSFTYSKVKGRVQYEYVLTSQKFKAASFNPSRRVRTVSGRNYETGTLTGLTKGVWYLGVRAYTMDGTKKVYGKWAVKRVSVM